MDYQHKAAALRALGDLTIRLRTPENCIGGDGGPSWYASIEGAEIKDGGVLHGDYGNGVTPGDAILDAWRAYVENVEPPRCVALHAADPARRRTLRWNGFMWADVPELST